MVHQIFFLVNASTHTAFVLWPRELHYKPLRKKECILSCAKFQRWLLGAERRQKHLKTLQMSDADQLVKIGPVPLCEV
ncbi:unnamed protein product [Rhodiola kirilowii]